MKESRRGKTNIKQTYRELDLSNGDEAYKQARHKVILEDLDNRKKLYSLISEAIGTASVCWTEIPTGVFDSTRAQKLANDLLLAVEKNHISGRKFTQLKECIEALDKIAIAKGCEAYGKIEPELIMRIAREALHKIWIEQKKEALCIISRKRSNDL